MKNVQVIDGAENCVFAVYAVDDDVFAAIFPEGRDVEFASDLFERLGDPRAAKLTEQLWANPQDKKRVNGIQGTLFYGLDHRKKYFPSKKEDEAVALP